MSKTDELRQALSWAKDRGLTPDDPRTARTICDTLGIKQEMVDDLHESLEGAQDGCATLTGIQEDRAARGIDALTALLDLAEES